jgi:hypothetical protein
VAESQYGTACLELTRLGGWDNQVRSISAPPSSFIELGSGAGSSATFIDRSLSLTMGRSDTRRRHHRHAPAPPVAGLANHVDSVRVRRVNPDAISPLSDGASEAREVIRFIKAVYRLCRDVVLSSARRTLVALNVDAWILRSSNPIARRLRSLVNRVEDDQGTVLPREKGRGDRGSSLVEGENDDGSDDSSFEDSSEGSGEEDEEATTDSGSGLEEETELDVREPTDLLVDISDSHRFPAGGQGPPPVTLDDFASVYVAHATNPSSSTPLTRRRYRRLSRKSPSPTPSPSSSDFALQTVIRERRVAVATGRQAGRGDEDGGTSRTLCSAFLCSSSPLNISNITDSYLDFQFNPSSRLSVRAENHYFMVNTHSFNPSHSFHFRDFFY